ncbi:hypothetical protein [Terribacillus saccharophilus]|uniref:Uncharacterized protein n=1 Tax=Terribacillus saccharophilus TaxID=361277 RepID=A0AAX2EJ24_9BACI|nr:hypothetical protein [Terribacillus goriensis]SEN95300.1 hypothetical protein SAMN04489762_3177 [Terribacillus saccharophilus]
MSKYMISFVIATMLLLTACSSDYESEMDEAFSSEKVYAEKENNVNLDEISSQTAVYRFGRHISISYVTGEKEVVGVYKRNSAGIYDRLENEDAVVGKDPVIRKVTIID